MRRENPELFPSAHHQAANFQYDSDGYVDEDDDHSVHQDWQYDPTKNFPTKLGRAFTPSDDKFYNREDSVLTDGPPPPLSHRRQTTDEYESISERSDVDLIDPGRPRSDRDDGQASQCSKRKEWYNQEFSSPPKVKGEHEDAASNGGSAGSSRRSEILTPFRSEDDLKTKSDDKTQRKDLDTDG